MGITDTYNVLGLFGLQHPKEAFPNAKAMAGKVIEIDDTLGEIYTSLGFASFFYDWDWKKAEAHFKQSLALNSTYATLHSWYSLYLVSMGRFEEAISEAEQALELDPLSLIINATAGCVYFIARQYKKA